MLFKGVICFAVYVDFSSALSLYPSDATALVESCRVILALHGLGCHEATTASNGAEFTVLAFSVDGRTLSLCNNMTQARAFPRVAPVTFDGTPRAPPFGILLLGSPLAT